MKQGQCICPLSWSLHCNFTGDGNGSERQKAAVTTLCTLWFDVTHKSGRDDAKSVGSVDFYLSLVTELMLH